MSLAAIHPYEKNIVAPDAIHAETNNLKKMSLSDLQEQNKERNLAGDESNQLQTRLPGAYSCVDEIIESIKRDPEWHASHSCTSCGRCKHSCPCNRPARRWSILDDPGPGELKKKLLAAKDKIYEDDTVPPSRAKRYKKFLEKAENGGFGLLNDGGPSEFEKMLAAKRKIYDVDTAPPSMAKLYKELLEKVENRGFGLLNDGDPSDFEMLAAKDKMFNVDTANLPRAERYKKWLEEAKKFRRLVVSPEKQLA